MTYIAGSVISRQAWENRKVGGKTRKEFSLSYGDDRINNGREDT